MWPPGGYTKSEPRAVATGSLPRHSTNNSLVQKRSGRAYLPATSGWVETWRLSKKLFGWCRHLVQYRERSDRVETHAQSFRFFSNKAKFVMTGVIKHLGNLPGRTHAQSFRFFP